MESLTIDQLHDLRNAIFDNAESFHKEALCLHASGFYARAYLSAYFTMEELGKLPMIVGTIGMLLSNDNVDWKKLKKRFTSHTKKIESEVFHHYVFGIDPSPFDKDVEWYQEKLKQVQTIYKKKNQATYVDVTDGCVINPLNCITEEDSSLAIAEAFDALKAHWTSESFTNPKLKTEQVKAGNSGKKIRKQFVNYRHDRPKNWPVSLSHVT